MLTEAQQTWIASLPDDVEIIIKPYDPTAHEKFELLEKMLRPHLGDDAKILHLGATSFGISGQDEIDVFIPVEESKYDDFVETISGLLGAPYIHLPLERTGFACEDFGKHIDVFVISETSEGWLRHILFDRVLRDNKEALEEYRELKEHGHGLSMREYYRRKGEFINRITGWGA